MSGFGLGAAATRQEHAMGITASSPIPHTRLVDAARPAALADVARAESAMARFLERPTVQSLRRDERARVADAVAAVQVLLARCADSIMAATTLGAVDEQVRQLRVVRPENHAVQVGLLQELSASAVAASAHRTMLDDLGAIVAVRDEVGQDVARVQQELAGARHAIAEATLAIASAREAALALSAVSSSYAIQAVGTQVDRVTRLLGQAAERIMLVELALQPVGVG